MVHAHTAIIDLGNPGVCHGVSVTAPVACTNDAEVLGGPLGALDSYQLFGVRTWETTVRPGDDYVKIMYLFTLE